MGDSDWKEYEKLIIDKLDVHTTKLESIQSQIVELQIAMGVVKTKLAMIGFASGMVSSIGIALLKNFLP